jgi:hypothetical protein
MNQRSVQAASRIRGCARRCTLRRATEKPGEWVGRCRTFGLVVSVVSAIGLSSGCATIISGTTQEVRANALPEGARLSIYRWNGIKLAELTAKDSRASIPRPTHQQSYIVVASAPGRCPRYWVTEGVGNPVVYWNLLLGGIVGSLVDANSGAGSAISPTEFDAELLAGESQCAVGCN